ncbi:MAG TPA: tyrosine-type recombinase/integrase [Pirellulales bacterium]|nr:tyrosine-type recombinase/integrase [Pirellulales bacterium]
MKLPYYKKSHHAWYADVGPGGKPVRLAKTQKDANGKYLDNDGKSSKEAAEREYHKRMAGAQPVNSATTIQELCQQFLDWAKKKKKPRTHQTYLERLTPFVAHCGSVKVHEARGHHIQSWIDNLPGGSTYKNGCAAAAARVFNWAIKQQLVEGLAINPVVSIERPQVIPREVDISDADWQRVLDAAQADFVDVLKFLDATGCRPQEVRCVSAAHREDQDLILERENSKGQKVRRVIRLNSAAAEIIDRLSKKHPTGPLFRGRKGQEYTAGAIAQRFSKLRNKLKINGLCAYAVRHRFAQRALRRGLTADTTGVLMGHVDGTMVRRVYGHLERQHQFLRDELDKATQ